MLKRLSHFFACLLVVLIPLQGFAAANMSACNALMQVATNQAKQQEIQTTPCHEHMAGMTKTSGDLSSNHLSYNHLSNNYSGKHKNACKTSCATLCSSLCAMTALPSNIKPATLQDTSKAMTLLSQSYASITLPSLQRPPILLS